MTIKKPVSYSFSQAFTQHSITDANGRKESVNLKQEINQQDQEGNKKSFEAKLGNESFQGADGHQKNDAKYSKKKSVENINQEVQRLQTNQSTSYSKDKSGVAKIHIQSQDGDLDVEIKPKEAAFEYVIKSGEERCIIVQIPNELTERAFQKLSPEIKKYIGNQGAEEDIKKMLADYVDQDLKKIENEKKQDNSQVLMLHLPQTLHFYDDFSNDALLFKSWMPYFARTSYFDDLIKDRSGFIKESNNFFNNDNYSQCTGEVDNHNQTAPTI